VRDARLLEAGLNGVGQRLVRQDEHDRFGLDGGEGEDGERLAAAARRDEQDVADALPERDDRLHDLRVLERLLLPARDTLDALEEPQHVLSGGQR